MTSATVGSNVTSPIAATEVTQGKSFGLGDRVTTHDGKEFVFVQASGAIASAGQIVVIDETYQAALLSTSNDARGDLVGVAPAAFADDDFGFVQVKGPAIAQVAASCAANVRLNTTATAGQVDDDGTVGAMQVQGLYLTAARGGTAGTAAAILNYPFIDVTL